MAEIKLSPTRCAICNTEENSAVLYPQKFDLAAFNPEIFSARRMPDRIHYRMVVCNTCGLVRSDPVADSESLAQLYAQSSFNYNDEVSCITSTYGRYLRKLESLGIKKGSLMEIGCGNGFFLEEALRQGYQSVAGVEPSTEAIAKASPQVRPTIVCDMVKPGLFEPNQFDVICMFQVLDHISDPASLIQECYKILKPGGVILCLNHNVKALSAKFLKEKSPIIDIEHTYLYSLTTLGNLCEKHGLKVIKKGSVLNLYSLSYIFQLFPFSRKIKQKVISGLKKTPLINRIRVLVPLGNLYLVAQKPVK